MIWFMELLKGYEEYQLLIKYYIINCQGSEVSNFVGSDQKLVPYRLWYDFHMVFS